MTERDRLIDAFLARAGWGGGVRSTLAADASFRRYDRIRLGRRNAVLMDAPPDKEDVAPFLHVARHLCRLGYSAPEVLAEDTAHGLLLLEDLGDDTYTRLLARGEDEERLYRLATDLLIDLHGRAADEAVPEGLPCYNDRLFIDEAALLIAWYLPAVTGRPTDTAIAKSYRDLWPPLLARARSVPRTLVLRDYHVDNLIRLADRTGVAACGLLDFQDAVAGPTTYDLVSLLEDARRDIAQALADTMRERYLAAFPSLDGEAFGASYAIMGAQRHCKVIGIFTRLCVRDGKPHYLDHIPRVWSLLERSLGHPELAPLRDWVDLHIPRRDRVVPPCRPQE